MIGKARALMHFAAAGIIPTTVVMLAAVIEVVEVGLVGGGALWALTFLALRARDVANQPPSGE